MHNKMKSFLNFRAARHPPITKMPRASKQRYFYFIRPGKALVNIYSVTGGGSTLPYIHRSQCSANKTKSYSNVMPRGSPLAEVRNSFRTVYMQSPDR